MNNLTLLQSARSDGEQSATQRTYDALRRMIILGEIAPGEKLKIEELRQRLDIGASPLREALSLLVSDQLVVRKDQRGFLSADISKPNYYEILELRLMLEERALRLSLKNATKDWEEAVVLSHYRLQRAEKDMSDNFEDLHRAFHMQLISNCDAPLLLKYCGQLYDLNIRYRFLAAGKASYKRRDIKSEHQRIVDAIVERDSEEAAKRLVEHYKLTGNYLSKMIYNEG